MSSEAPKTEPMAKYQLPSADFSGITEPGTYVMHRTGLLVRVPPDAMGAGRSPVITVAGRSPVWVSKVSDDPWIPAHMARSIAADHDLYVNF